MADSTLRVRERPVSVLLEGMERALRSVDLRYAGGAYRRAPYMSVVLGAPVPTASDASGTRSQAVDINPTVIVGHIDLSPIDYRRIELVVQELDILFLRIPQHLQ